MPTSSSQIVANLPVLAAAPVLGDGIGRLGVGIGTEPGFVAVNASLRPVPWGTIAANGPWGMGCYVGPWSIHKSTPPWVMGGNAGPWDMGTGHGPWGTGGNVGTWGTNVGISPWCMGTGNGPWGMGPCGMGADAFTALTGGHLPVLTTNKRGNLRGKTRGSDRICKVCSTETNTVKHHHRQCPLRRLLDARPPLDWASCNADLNGWCSII